MIEVNELSNYGSCRQFRDPDGLAGPPGFWLTEAQQALESGKPLE